MAAIFPLYWVADGLINLSVTIPDGLFCFICTDSGLDANSGLLDDDIIGLIDDAGLINDDIDSNPGCIGTRVSL